LVFIIDDALLPRKFDTTRRQESCRSGRRSELYEFLQLLKSTGSQW